VIIGMAENAIAKDIQNSLPHVTFEAWLRSVVGPRAVMTWEANDCGEQTGSSADRGRDFPVCAEVKIGLTGERRLSISLAVGTVEKGLLGPPQLFDASLERSHGDVVSIATLSEIRALIR